MLEVVRIARKCTYVQGGVKERRGEERTGVVREQCHTQIWIWICNME
jgi:hypothetical protein